MSKLKCKEKYLAIHAETFEPQTQWEWLSKNSIRKTEILLTSLHPLRVPYRLLVCLNGLNQSYFLNFTYLYLADKN